MKQCIHLIDEEYDGELRFSIIESEISADACVLTLGAYDGEELVGFKVSVPVMTKKMLFKTFQFIHPNGVVTFSTIGKKSDRLISSLKKYFNPAYEPTDGFSNEAVEIDYKLRNQGTYDLKQDKLYLRLFYDEEQDADLPKNERIHLSMDFAFNLSREMASLIEVKEGYAADLISFLMK